VVGNYRSQGSDEANGQLKAKVLESGQIFLFSHGQDPKRTCESEAGRVKSGYIANWKLEIMYINDLEWIF